VLEQAVNDKLTRMWFRCELSGNWYHEVC